MSVTRQQREAWFAAFDDKRKTQPRNICMIQCNDIAISAGVCGCANFATTVTFGNMPPVVTDDHTPDIEMTRASVAKAQALGFPESYFGNVPTAEPRG